MLLLQILQNLPDIERNSVKLAYSRPPLCIPDDFPFLLAQIQKHSLQNPPQEFTTGLIELATRVFDATNEDHLSTLFPLFDILPYLRASFEKFLLVPLDSTIAENRREQKANAKEDEQTQAAAFEKHEERIQELRQLINNGEIDKWTGLFFELLKEPPMWRPPVSLVVDITTSYGWENADPILRKEILEAANSYLSGWQPDTKGWLREKIEEGKSHYDAYSAIAAFCLLHVEYPNALDLLEVSIWVHWAPFIASYYVSNEGQAPFSEIFKICFLKAPTEMIDTLEKLLRAYDKTNGNALSLQRFQDCWNVDLE
ncbi:MAG: hypothetical protein R3C44_02680, partial [Chloroflexota bacterium]